MCLIVFSGYSSGDNMRPSKKKMWFVLWGLQDEDAVLGELYGNQLKSAKVFFSSYYKLSMFCFLTKHQNIDWNTCRPNLFFLIKACVCTAIVLHDIVYIIEYNLDLLLSKAWQGMWLLH